LKILGDKDALKQILLIALDNALKHSSGDIRIDVQRKGWSAEIRVQDSGDGISPEKLEHIFDRFYRGDEVPTIQGFGLGLPIAKALVEAQQGGIRLESQVGEGSTVVIELPIAIS
jgi:signal transduction histidine kinase